MNDPIQKFLGYWDAAKNVSGSANRNSICVSTIDEAGYPNARFVDLKEVSQQGFVFCTDLESQKAREIGLHSKTSICLWWEHISLQCRIRGECTRISDDEANRHWVCRSRDGQLASVVARQDRPLESVEALRKAIAATEHDLLGQPIQRPESWGGFRLAPDRIEFLEFSHDRLHLRTLYTLQGGVWETTLLQP